MTAPADASGRFRLERTPLEPVQAPLLDPAQRAVVDHHGGPLLVLAGPGTGKTTTIVESVVARVRQGTPAERVLVLTFSRRAAAELRERITARLGATTSGLLAWTFHAFCYALVRAHQQAEIYGQPMRLLSAPEQEVALRDLLPSGAIDPRAATWPGQLAAALGTRGFAEEVRALLARARELGLEPAQLSALGAAADRDDWSAAGVFLGEYLDVLDARGVLDYAELVHRAVVLAEQPEVRAALRGAYDVVLVDEYQDTDPAQERLLQAMAGDGRDLLVVGDPDQSIYAFRGADVSNIVEFPDRFPRADGAPAGVLSLIASRRSGPALLAASRSVAERMSLGRLPVPRDRDHRHLQAAGPAAGSVRVLRYPSQGAELDGTADLLRRAHLEDGLSWGDMAVLVRSGAQSIPLVRRVLGAAGVPVEVAGDELPLAQEPAVAPLLLALRCAADPSELSAERARVLLLSPLGGADAAGLRWLGRALRADERSAAAAAGLGTRQPRASGELIRQAVAEPELLVSLDRGVSGPARRLGELIRRTRDVLADGGTPEDALWVLWDGTPWPRRLAGAAAAGGAAGRSADRDLDAVCALFDAAARAEERAGHIGAQDLLAELEAQQIPGDTLAERATRSDSVRLLTAHRSKGLEWRLVAVCGVQESRWPDLRRRGSLLEPDRLARSGLVPPPSASALLAEERRLFYVAVTRARERLVVSAVDSGEDDGERPSRFLDELGVPSVMVAHRPTRPLSIAGLTASLRAACVDPDSSPQLRQDAVRRLARLAQAADQSGRPLVPAAHPGSWWGIGSVSAAPEPLHAPEQPVRLSGSSVSRLEECPLRWFLEHEVHADTARSAALGFGSVVHVLADGVGRGDVPADLDVLMERLDRVWSGLAFEARWQSDQQRDAARAAVQRFLHWHGAERGRRTIATEHRFEVTVETPAGAVTLRGSMDRVEVDAAGRVHVVDFKTGRQAPTGPEVEAHPQLGLYQLAVSRGALADPDADSDPDAEDRTGPVLAPPQLGGAELVHLRLEHKGLPKVQRQAPLAAPDGTTWVEHLLLTSQRRVLAEDFPPVPNESCDRCAFRRCCSAWPEGAGVVT